MSLHIIRLTRFKGIEDIITAWPVYYNATYQTIQDSAEYSSYDTRKAWHHGRQFSL